MSQPTNAENVIVKYFKKYWYYIVGSIIFSTLSNYYNLQLPQFFSYLVDEIIQNRRFDLIVDFIFNLAAIFLWAGIYDLLRTLVVQYLSTNVVFEIRNDMYKALQRQSYSFYDQNRTGNLMSKATSDVNVVRNFLADQFRNFIKNIISFILIFSFVWQMNWIMALLFLALTPPLYFLMMWYRKRIRPASYKMYQARGELISTIQENITGVRVVKAFGRESMELKKYHRENTDFIEKSKDVIKLQTFYGPFSEFITMAGSTLLVFIGGSLVIKGIMTLGEVVATFAYFSMVYDPIRAIVNFFNQLAANKAAMDRVNSILENRSEIEVPTKPLDPGRALGDLYLRLLKDENIFHKIDNFMGVKTNIVDETQAIQSKLLPRGIKLGASQKVGYKGDRPILLSKGDEIAIRPIATKFIELTKNSKFQNEFKKYLKNYKENAKIDKKSWTIFIFIYDYLRELIQNDELMLEIYRTLSSVEGDKEISDLKNNPIDSLFSYIEYLAISEYELNRVAEIQKLLYSPAPKEKAAIAKKYEKLLKKKGLFDEEKAQREEDVLQIQKSSRDAVRFLELEKDIIEKEREKLRKEGKLIEKDEEEKVEPIKITPIQMNTKFEEICRTPVKPTQFNGHVVFQDVYFAYPEQRKNEFDEENWALSEISLDVKPGESIAFLGATGSGKSTLINLIPRFYDVTRGKLFIDGVNIKELELKNYRRQIGIVAQETFLFSRSIKNNISYGKSRVKFDDIVAVAKIAKIHDFIMNLPDKYNTVIGERGQTLSGGQKQRIAIARALLLDPKILILDDSLSAVDVDTEFEIQEALDHLFEGRTTFIITQRLSTIRNCDRIAVLDDGKIVELGTHDELIAKDGIYKILYNTMFKKEERKKKEFEELKKEQQELQARAKTQGLEELDEKQKRRRRFKFGGFKEESESATNDNEEKSDSEIREKEQKGAISSSWKMKFNKRTKQNEAVNEEENI